MKKFLIVLFALIIIGGGGFAAWKYFLQPTVAKNDVKAYVTSVSEITGTGTLGLSNRLSGVVEPQKEVKIERDENKKISKINVEEGDNVKVGDVLFEYDLDAMQLSLEQAELELETIETKITTLQTQLETYEKEKEQASAEQQLEYSIEIQSTELEIKTEEYNKAEKASEIKELKASLKNSKVTCEIDGIVKSVKKPNDNDYGYGNDSNTFISILSLGNYRVKGTVTELNRNSIYEGEDVVIRSRVDDELTWNAMIISISNQQDENNNNDGYYYYGGGGNGESASKYTFYAELENQEGLMLGQHVYVEEALGGESSQRAGLWIPSYYFSFAEDGAAYLWVAPKNGTLSKTAVSLGEYDEELDTYEVLAGLTADDFLAFPEYFLVDGMPTTTDMAEAQQSQENLSIDNDNNGDAESTGNDDFVGDEEPVDYTDEFMDLADEDTIDEDFYAEDGGVYEDYDISEEDIDYSEDEDFSLDEEDWAEFDDNEVYG